MRKQLLFLLIILFSAFFAGGQEFSKLHYTVEDGLPSNKIYDVYRDSKGFLWIATDKGIARYNGIRFDNFTVSDGLSDNEVFFFQEDDYRRLWFGTANGELCFYKDGVFHTSQNTPFLKLPFKPYFTAYINIEYDHTVTIGFRGQPYFVNIGESNYKWYDMNTDYNNNIALLKVRDSILIPNFYQ